MTSSPFNHRPHAKSSMAFNYRSDGQGRDSYIYNNNGGFAINYHMAPPHDSGLMQSPTKKQGRPKISPPQNKPVHYIGDGSGRDGYISINNGGLTNEVHKNTG